MAVGHPRPTSELVVPGRDEAEGEEGEEDETGWVGVRA